MGNVPHFIQSAATSIIGETALAPESIDLVVAEQQGPQIGSEPARATNFHRILGIEFFDGSARAAVALMRNGGLLVIPAAPALKDLNRNHGYREALLNADLAITDSAFMVLIWNGLQSKSIKRLSGLEYLRTLLLDPDVRRPGNTLWIMANAVSAKRNLDWLQGQGITVPEDNIYIAPMYDNGPISDPALLERLDRLRPQHVIMTIGGGLRSAWASTSNATSPAVPRSTASVQPLPSSAATRYTSPSGRTSITSAGFFAPCPNRSATYPATGMPANSSPSCSATATVSPTSSRSCFRCVAAVVAVVLQLPKSSSYSLSSPTRSADAFACR